MTNFIKKLSVPQIIVGAYASLILIGVILSQFDWFTRFKNTHCHV